MYLYKGKSKYAAAAFATARDTPNKALAPNFDLVFVPSSCNNFASIVVCYKAEKPFKAGAMMLLMCSTALVTPLPKYLFLSPSRNSMASFSPVDAPEGTDALPNAPDSKYTSTSTVGLPLESRISLPIILSILISV